MEITAYLRMCEERRASDLHLLTDEPPVLRVNGALQRTDRPALSEAELARMLLGLMSDTQRAAFDRDSDVNMALTYPGFDRYRVNIHRQRGQVEAAFRRIPAAIPTLELLGLPKVVGELAMKPNGLVLVTGPVGTGKSTTMAAMVDQINAKRDCLIVTIEDPIEYLHRNKKSFVVQREVYSDTPSFSMALKNALRQDPNVIVVGEMRDLETISTALTAAETGHLVLATLHTPNAAQSIQRIIDVFPAGQQMQVRTQLANTLQGVVSQLLLPDALRVGRMLATEILVVTPALRNLIRQNQIEQIGSFIQTGGKLGMQTMAKSLSDLVKAGKVDCELAKEQMNEPEDVTCPLPA
ncbi:MAG: type IV pilus twitching motility protein PilT [Armatimonadota bacterium]